MEKFEIYKLKEAGLSNEQVLRVLDYCRKDQALPSIEEIARMARCRSIIHFVDKYRQLDEDHLHKEFERFPSLSIFDPEYPEELLQIYNPPVLLFYQGDLQLLTRPKIAVVGARETTREGVRSVEKIIKELGMNWSLLVGLQKGLMRLLIMPAFAMVARPSE